MDMDKEALAYSLFLEIYAERTGDSISKIRSEISQEEFEQRVHQLHSQWLAGEFSFGRFTELIGVPHWELWEILDALGLQIHK